MNDFELNFNELNFFNNEGNPIQNPNEYFKEMQKKNITADEKLSEGDFVKLKGVNYLVHIKYINYKIPGVGMVDYVGIKVNSDDNSFVLFNQKDIEKVCVFNTSKTK